MKMQFVVIFGRIDIGVQTVHGPFASTELAERWVRESGSKEQPHTIYQFSVVRPEWNHSGATG